MKKELLLAAGAVGAIATLLKPFSMDELMNSIQNILGLH
jgi:DNA-binding response OmpR family regulator